MTSDVHHLAGEAATEQLGSSLAKRLGSHVDSQRLPCLVIYLLGDLGAGKSTLVRSILRALGVSGPIKSPTYSLVELYSISNLNLYHFDFYRFNSPDEFIEAGLEEYFDGRGICFIEWPGKALGFLPPADIVIEIQPVGVDQRNVVIRAENERGRACLMR